MALLKNALMAPVLAAVAVATACGPSESTDKNHCQVHADCLGGYICVQGSCISAIQDAAAKGDDGPAGNSCSLDAQAISANSPPPPPQLAFMIEDFERGPGAPESFATSCTLPIFGGQKPGGLGQSCDGSGVNPSGCRGSLYCEGTSSAGICPDYLGQNDGAWRGDYSLRLNYNLDASPDSYAGLVLELAAPVCLVNRSPLDLSQYETVSMRLRAMDAQVNAEVALRDSTAVETLPKTVLVQSGDTPMPAGQWVEKRFKLCDLLIHAPTGAAATKLNRGAITEMIIGFARSRFVTEGTYSAGSHFLDIDDVTLQPCPTAGCQPCP